jgi:hypothetical protein
MWRLRLGLFLRGRRDSETRLSKKSSVASRRRLGPERKRCMQIWRELLLPRQICECRAKKKSEEERMQQS